MFDRHDDEDEDEDGWNVVLVGILLVIFLGALIVLAVNGLYRGYFDA